MTSKPQTLEELAVYLEQRSQENRDHSHEAHDDGTCTWHAGKAAAYASAAYKVREMIPPEYPKAIVLSGLLRHGCTISTGDTGYRADSKEHEHEIIQQHAEKQSILRKECMGVVSSLGRYLGKYCAYCNRLIEVERPNCRLCRKCDEHDKTRRKMK